MQVNMKIAYGLIGLTLLGMIVATVFFVMKRRGMEVYNGKGDVQVGAPLRVAPTFIRIE